MDEVNDKFKEIKIAHLTNNRFSKSVNGILGFKGVPVYFGLFKLQFAAEDFRCKRCAHISGIRFEFIIHCRDV